MVEAACEGFVVNCLYQELTGAARPCPPGAVTNPNSQILRLRRAVDDDFFSEAIDIRYSDHGARPGVDNDGLSAKEYPPKFHGN